MFSYLLHQMMYPKAVVLLSTSLLVLVWAGYFCTALAKRYGTLSLKQYAYYICYTIGVFFWTLSNSYFHTDLLVRFGDSVAINMAILANLATLLAFVSAYCFISKLHKHYTNKSVALWQDILVANITLFGFISNLMPGGTIQGIEIMGPSDFQLKFGPYTKYFFLGFTTLVLLTFFNLLSLKKSSNRIRKTRTNYMIMGITIFMSSTAVIQVGMTFFFDNFSLTWLPPTLSLSEMLLMGYALLTSRFFSPRYLCFIFVSVASTAFIYVAAVSAFVPATLIGLADVLLLTLIIGMTWNKLYRLVQRVFSMMMYGDPIHPVEKISRLEDEFQSSPTRAMESLANYLGVPQDKLRLLDDYRDVNLYRSYFESHGTSLVIEEVEEELLNSNDNALSLIHSNMSQSQSALVIPLYASTNKLSHVLVSSSKSEGLHFSYEELSALERVLNKVQVHINYEREVRQSQALASSIAHEMRNPFAQLQLEFELIDQAIKHTYTTELLKSHVDKGTKAITRSHQLIDIIVRELDEASLDQEPVVPSLISAVIWSSIDQYGFDDEAMRDRIHLDFEHDFVVEINDTLFSFVLFNLVRNATYYFDSYPKSRISIQLKKGHGENCVLFRDTGPGIPENLIGQIFDDFFSHNKSGGSGLGLGYCQRVMASFGGSISCQSKVGSYTEFKLAFPPTNRSLDTLLVRNPKQENQLMSPLDVALN